MSQLSMISKSQSAEALLLESQEEKERPESIFTDWWKIRAVLSATVCSAKTTTTTLANGFTKWKKIGGLQVGFWAAMVTTVVVTIVSKLPANTFTDYLETFGDAENQCPKWETYDVKALRNKVFTDCRNLNDEYPDMNLTDTFQVNLCMNRYSCGEGYFQITRKDQDACQMAFKQEVSWDDDVDQLIKRDIGPDGFWLKFDGPERLTPTDWRHQGNCTYKLPFRLSTTGIFNVTLVHIYDNFTANNEAEFYKWYRPKFDVILSNYLLDVCADVGCKPWRYSDLHNSADLPVCGRDDTYQGVFLRMADPPSPREEWLLKSYGYPYIWHPLGCRIPHTYFRNDSSDCFKSNKTMLIIGDSQSRGTFDLAQLRLDGLDVPFDHNNKNAARKDGVYAPVGLFGPDFGKFRLKYRWESYLNIFSQYAIGGDRFDGYRYEADRYFQEMDIAFVNTGHWAAAGLQHGGFWNLPKYVSYVEYVLNTMKQINKQQEFYGGKVTRFIWVGVFAVGMFQPEGTQAGLYKYYSKIIDHRAFYRLKLWSDAVRDMVNDFGFQFIDGNFMTSSWVRESPDGPHFHTTPDVLNDFKEDPPTPSLPLDSNPAGLSSTDNPLGSFDDEFAKQLAAGMEQLMGGLGGADFPEDLKATMDQFLRDVNVGGDELKEFEGLKIGSSSKTTTSTSAKVKKSEGDGGSFQSKIAETMSKLRDSSDKVQAQVSNNEFDPSLLGEAGMEDMMKELEAMMNTSEFESMFGNIMEQLMSKDVLYEPMKDLHTKYPEWLKNNKDKVAAEDYARYEKQYVIIQEIMEVYSAGGDSEEDNKKVVNLMQKMQDCGNPPQEILNELAPGMDVGADGIPKMPGMDGKECVIM
ncbi:Peroxisome chaperone and import receptor [Chytridiales sp. JEL 0842]|nr:Peroxisome chaperone and import receptor [Chytridiales sp. JEL 0842]